MTRRVSSRPRLVSDADRAFQNATVEEYDGYSSLDDGLNLDNDDDGADDVQVYRNGGDIHHQRYHGHGGRHSHQAYLQQEMMAVGGKAAGGPTMTATFAFSGEGDSFPYMAATASVSSSIGSDDAAATAVASVVTDLTDNYDHMDHFEEYNNDAHADSIAYEAEKVDPSRTPIATTLAITLSFYA